MIHARVGHRVLKMTLFTNNDTTLIALSPEEDSEMANLRCLIFSA